MATLLIFLGLGLLAIEVAVLGFSVMILFFIGLGCLATGLLILIGLIPASLAGAMLGTGILSLIAAVGLWKPLKRMQDSTQRKAVTSDLIGYEFDLESAVSAEQPGTVQFSGISWQVVAHSKLDAGSRVKVIATDVGKLTVAPA